jgi:hypothetical protein
MLVRDRKALERAKGSWLGKERQPMKVLYETRILSAEHLCLAQCSRKALSEANPISLVFPYVCRGCRHVLKVATSEAKTVIIVGGRTGE